MNNKMLYKNEINEFKKDTVKEIFLTENTKIKIIYGDDFNYIYLLDSDNNVLFKYRERKG